MLSTSSLGAVLCQLFLVWEERAIYTLLGKKSCPTPTEEVGEQCRNPVKFLTAVSSRCCYVTSGTDLKENRLRSTQGLMHCRTSLITLSPVARVHTWDVVDPFQFPTLPDEEKGLAQTCPLSEVSALPMGYYDMGFPQSLLFKLSHFNEIIIGPEDN